MKPGNNTKSQHEHYIHNSRCNIFLWLLTDLQPRANICSTLKAKWFTNTKLLISTNFFIPLHNNCWKWLQKEVEETVICDSDNIMWTNRCSRVQNPCGLDWVAEQGFRGFPCTSTIIRTFSLQNSSLKVFLL